MQTDNFKRVQQVLWLILLLNWLVAFVKIVIGTVIKSTSLTADGFHSLTDGASNIVGLIGIRFAARPVDEDHPYGHKKFETLVGLFIGGMLLLIAGKIFSDAIPRFTQPVHPQITLLSLFTLLATLVCNIFVATYEFRQGKRLNSAILVSDSLHTRSDIFVSLGVLATLIGLKLGLPPITDALASLVVIGFIVMAALEIFKETLGVLTDKIAVDPAHIKEIVMTFDQVKDAHKIRSRGREDDIYIDLHILIQPDMSVEDSHSLIHKIEAKIQKELNKNVQTIIHIEPFYDKRNKMQ